VRERKKKREKEIVLFFPIACFNKILLIFFYLSKFDTVCKKKKLTKVQTTIKIKTNTSLSANI